jgi:hypothetical protein
MTHPTESPDSDWADDDDSESPFSASSLAEIRQAVVFAADWTVGTIIDQMASSSVNLSPRYQRRDAWDINRKSRFVESLILGLPVPQIVLAEDKDEPGKFIVLDGKQRLTTLLQFVGGLPTSPNNNFPLRELPLLEALNRKCWSEMVDDPNFAREKRQFLNQPIRSTVIRNWQSEAFLHLLFHRLNSNSLPLSAQELRQAMIKGEFLTYLAERSAGSIQIQRILRIDEPDFRMRDAEIMLRLEAFCRFMPRYRGDLQSFLDSAAREINRSWPSGRDRFDEDIARFEQTIDLWGDALGPENVGRKFVSSRYQGRLNRAVLDAQVLSVEDATARANLTNRPADAKRAFELLCLQDDRFLRSIEQTTKRLESVHYRIDSLKSILASIA